MEKDLQKKWFAMHLIGNLENNAADVYNKDYKDTQDLQAFVFAITSGRSYVGSRSGSKPVEIALVGRKHQ